MFTIVTLHKTPFCMTTIKIQFFFTNVTIYTKKKQSCTKTVLKVEFEKLVKNIWNRWYKID